MLGGGPLNRGKMPAEMEAGMKMKAKKSTATGKKAKKGKKAPPKNPWTSQNKGY